MDDLELEDEGELKTTGIMYYHLGVAFEEGRRTNSDGSNGPPNLAAAVACLRMAADEHGEKKAVALLVEAYGGTLEGRGLAAVEPDPQEHHHYVVEHAELGDHGAIERCALAAEYGESCDVDLGAASKWLELLLNHDGADYAALKKMGTWLKEGGPGLAASLPHAYYVLTQAAEEAMNAGKGTRALINSRILCTLLIACPDTLSVFSGKLSVQCSELAEGCDDGSWSWDGPNSGEYVAEPLLTT